MITPKQEKFCQQYALCRNATQAAIIAGYASGSARQQAARLMSKVNIKTRIGELLADSAQKAEVELIEVMKELKNILSANMSDFADWTKKTVTLKAKSELSQDLIAAVESIGEARAADGTRLLKIRLHSKLRAAELLIKLHEISETETRLAKLEELIAK